MRNAERLECGILGFGEALVVNNEPASNEFRIPRSAFRIPPQAFQTFRIPQSAIRDRFHRPLFTKQKCVIFRGIHSFCFTA